MPHLRRVFIFAPKAGYFYLQPFRVLIALPVSSFPIPRPLFLSQPTPKSPCPILSISFCRKGGKPQISTSASCASLPSPAPGAASSHARHAQSGTSAMVSRCSVQTPASKLLPVPPHVPIFPDSGGFICKPSQPIPALVPRSLSRSFPAFGSGSIWSDFCPAGHLL